MNIGLSNYLKKNKFTVAVLFSAGAHILALYLASTWAIDVQEKRTRPREIIITRIYLEEPVEPKPPERRVIEAAPWSSANAKNEMRAVAPTENNFSEVKVAGIDSTEKTSFTNKVEDITLSPIKPSKEEPAKTAQPPSRVVAQEIPDKSPTENSTPRASAQGFPPAKIYAAMPSTFENLHKIAAPPTPVKPSGQLSSAKIETPATQVADNEWMKILNRQRGDPFSPVVHKFSGQDHASRSPANLSDFRTKYSKSKRSSPVKIASFPTDFKESTTGNTITGDESAEILGEYTRRIRDRIAEVKKFPRLAKERGYEGQPVVAFTLKKDGGLVEFTLALSSGHRILDKSALETIKKAVPYPEIPDKLNVDSINFKLPISYILQ